MKKIIFITAILFAFISSSLATVNKPFISGIQLTEGIEFATGEDSPKLDQIMGMRIYMALSYNALIAITSASLRNRIMTTIVVMESVIHPMTTRVFYRSESRFL